MTEMRKVRMFVPWVEPECADDVAWVLASGWIGLGPEVEGFERELAPWVGTDKVLCVNSGTSALRLALAVAGVGPGDEVITTAMTCTATNTPILEQFAIPVFADIDWHTGNIDPADVQRRIGPATRAIVCVDWAGYPCELDLLMGVAKRYGLVLIEDAAHSFGATFFGKRVGSIAHMTAFSFQAIKHVTCGDGGALTFGIDGEHFYEEARIRRWYGIDRQNRVLNEDTGYYGWPQVYPGYKYEMNDIAAAVGRRNLQSASERLRGRRERDALYREGLSRVAGVTMLESKWQRESACWLFTMRVEGRSRFIRAMRSRGVETSVVHLRNDVHPMFGPRRTDLPNLDDYEPRYVCLPMHDHLTDEDVDYVIECVRQGW